MRVLNIDIEINGTMIRAGNIYGNNSQDACFRYSAGYLNMPGAMPVSVSLPLDPEPFYPIVTRNFFEGLLPEGFTRRSVAQWMRVDEADYLAILHGLGCECLGAVCVTEDGESYEAAYEKVTKTQMKKLAAEGALKSAEFVAKSHLSLAGASGKVGLYHSPKDGSWYLPYGTAPSTHIIKQSHVRLDNVVANEQLCMLAASYCGLLTPESFIINTGSGSDGEVLFATKRYDREIIQDAGTINGLPRPLRLHQEDFAQAMGISSAEKYEHRAEGYLKGMFSILNQRSADPVRDQIMLWDAVIFDYLIGNTDAHIKNFSLIYSKDLKAIRLAPIYDIISTTIYEQSTRDMAFSIGGVYSIDDIDVSAFHRAAKELGMGGQLAMQRFDRLCRLLPDALSKAADELVGLGFKDVPELKKRILKTGGIAKTKR